MGVVIATSTTLVIAGLAVCSPRGHDVTVIACQMDEDVDVRRGRHRLGVVPSIRTGSDHDAN